MLVASCGGASPPPAAPAAPETLEARYRAPVDRVAAASREADFAWRWLEALCGGIGHRLSGSESLERAVTWAEGELSTIDGARVELQPVEVERWVRGEESLVLLGEPDEPLAMIGLGNSAGTGETPVEADVVVVGSLEELAARGDEVRGKVVLFDAAMPAYDPESMSTGYGDLVGLRIGGPAAAGAAGAVAVLLRSITADPDSPPHTGMTRYEEGGPRIPAAAITIPDAERLHRMIDDGQTVRVRLAMGARLEGTATSHNVIAELEGSERPGEVVVFGGHIDSWDVGQGCHDDGAGVVSAMAALRLIGELGLRPRRTVRVVLWTNEENGLAGARAYAAEHGASARHVAGVESDIGAAPVIALSVEHPDEARGPAALARLEEITRLLAPLGVTRAVDGHSGADLSPLRELGMPGVGMVHDPAHYFDLHHTAADTIDAVDRDAFLQGVAAMTATVYILADMETPLGE